MIQELTREWEEDLLPPGTFNLTDTGKRPILLWPAEIRELIPVHFSQRPACQGYVYFHVKDGETYTHGSEVIPQICPPPSDIGSAFSTLCRVLFSKNRIKLTISGILYESPFNSSIHFSNVNIARLVEETWGRDTLLNIRDLVVRLSTDDEESHGSMCEAFRDVAEVLKDARV
ncbi:hypothetical protein N431DRAFT_455048 [Stipitochalara longipes BDJ]|nr:hypothetical protein N431DRAFT_455048 [Stipitochalara longipes BDJ]